MSGRGKENISLMRSYFHSNTKCDITTYLVVRRQLNFRNWGWLSRCVCVCMYVCVLWVMLMGSIHLISHIVTSKHVLLKTKQGENEGSKQHLVTKCLLHKPEALDSIPHNIYGEKKNSLEIKARSSPKTRWTAHTGLDG